MLYEKTTKAWSSLSTRLWIIMDDYHFLLNSFLYFSNCHKNHKSLLQLKKCFLEVAATAAAKSLQSCPTLRDPIDGSPPGSPVMKLGVYKFNTVYLINVNPLTLSLQHQVVLWFSMTRFADFIYKLGLATWSHRSLPLSIQNDKETSIEHTLTSNF